MEQERKRPRLYSRRGDLGETSMAFGPRVGKDHRRIELSGVIEELSSLLGVVRAVGVEDETARVLKRLQVRLFEVRQEVLTSAPAKLGIKIVTEADIKAIERVIDLWDARLPSCRTIAIPGGSLSASFIYMAWAECRKAERRACALLRFDPEFSPRVGAWLNRASDLLYVLARLENVRLGVAEETYADSNDGQDLF